MGRPLSLALVLAFVAGSVSLEAEQPPTAPAARSYSGVILGDGPVATSGLREASLALLVTPQQDERTADVVSALREVARGIPLGAKVNIRMRSGEKIRAARLRAVKETGVVIEKPRQSGWDAFGNRVEKPMPLTTVEVPYDSLQSIGQNHSLRNTLIVLVAAAGLLVAAPHVAGVD